MYTTTIGNTIVNTKSFLEPNTHKEYTTMYPAIEAVLNISEVLFLKYMI